MLRKIITILLSVAAVCAAQTSITPNPGDPIRTGPKSCVEGATSITCSKIISALSIIESSTASKPTCAVGVRGMFYVEKGAPGAADAVFVCVKKADNTYAWGTVGLTVP